MNRRVIILIFLFIEMGIGFVHAQTLTKYAQQKQHEVAERKRMEKANYEKACQIGTLDAFNEYLSMYPKGQFVKDVKSRITALEVAAEHSCFENACRCQTSQALQDYIERYPNGHFVQDAKDRIEALEKEAERTYFENACSRETSQALLDYIDRYPNGRYVQDARARIEDVRLWQDAKNKNTIVAYRNYLNKSSAQSYSQLANAAIAELESREEWEQIRRTTSKTVVENFINTHPKSSCIDAARKRYEELLAVEYYEQGELQRAYENFEAAGGRSMIDISNQSKFDDCLEYRDFIKLNTTKESELLAFLKKYPHGKYYNEVSNMVAMEKARSLTIFSGDNKYNEALLYARDNSTRKFVQSCIDNSRQGYRLYNRKLKWERHNANGKLIQLGFEIIDAGLNPSTYEKYDNYLNIVWFYNGGLSLKVGNYADPVQFEVGVKAGIIGYMLSPGTDEEKNKVRFHMPLFARLKINLFSVDDSTKFYIDAIGYYNTFTNKYLENEFAASGGIGVAWRHWDWSIYYKGDLNNKYKLDNDYIATSFKYYF